MVTLMLLTIIGLNLWQLINIHLTRKHPASIRQVNLENKNMLKVKKAGDHDWVLAEIENTTILPGMLMLKLKESGPANQTLSLLVANDAVSTDEFRQICAWANQCKSATNQ